MNAEGLRKELEDLEGILHQDPETGKRTMFNYVDKYTNRLFGAPFQLLDSVDKRFKDVNPNLGSEYIRNFMLNSPILRIRPGMPKYTGGDNNDSIFTMLKDAYFTPRTSNLSAVEGLMQVIAKQTVFKAGSKLQRRMFGFRETYYDYMQHVNYMCRSCAVFLYLTEGEKFPTGTFAGDSNTMTEFSKFNWSDYRMMTGSKAMNPAEYLGSLLGHSVDRFRQAGHNISNFLVKLTGGESLDNPETVANWLESRMGMNGSNVQSTYDLADQLDFKNMTEYGGVNGIIGMKKTAVEFMVEPTSFEETLTNTTSQSMLESTIDGLNSIGSEIAWITNSHADTGVVGGVMEFLGSSIETATTGIADLVQGVTGGFAGGLFSGAVSSIKGQKMIYPEIYKSSNSEMNYNFKVHLNTPYGDVYNYYMNIVVPLMHLIALAAPRMVTSNTVASPYLVQSYIPGQCTCQLGIISNMVILKNPNGNKVSVNGFPLEVDVTFTIKELYNAMSISPSNDPASFMFNETLNDYLANLSGLIPSIDTYVKQREATFYALEDYITGGGVVQDLAQVAVEKFEDFVNPFTGR